MILLSCVAGFTQKAVITPPISLLESLHAPRLPERVSTLRSCQLSDGTANSCVDQLQSADPVRHPGQCLLAVAKRHKANGAHAVAHSLGVSSPAGVKEQRHLQVRHQKGNSPQPKGRESNRASMGVSTWFF